MSLRKLIANLFGLAGCAAVGWGVHGVFLVGACGGVGAAPCPPEVGIYAAAVASGTVVAIVAGAFGPSIAPIVLFPAVGAAALLAVPELTGGARVTAQILGVAFLAVVLIPLVAFGLYARRQRRGGRLVERGTAGIGVVLDIRDTGVTVNRDPRVALTLRIEPEDGSPPFTAEKAAVVPRVAIPRQGQRFPVWFDPADPRRLVLVTKVEQGAPAAVRELFAKAQAMAPTADATPVNGGADPVDRLAKLYELYRAGGLTEGEYETQKHRILQPGPPGY